MPREPKPPKDFIIEGLSTRKRGYSVQVVDDFTGRPVERPLMPLGHGPLPTAAQRMRKREQDVHKREQEQTQRTAQALTKILTNMLDPPEHKPFKRRF